MPASREGDVGDAKRWVIVIVFPILGLWGLWWADKQLEAMRAYVGATFDLWPEWRILGLYLTIILVGAAFSLAASAAGAGRSRAHTGLTLVAVAIPLAIVVYTWLWFTFESLPDPGAWTFPISSVLRFGPASPTVVASCVIVGFLTTGLLTSRLTWTR